MRCQPILANSHLLQPPSPCAPAAPGLHAELHELLPQPQPWQHVQQRAVTVALTWAVAAVMA